MQYGRIFTILGIFILLGITAYAGKFTFSSILTGTGTKATVTWSQGCVDPYVGNAGPNQCLSTKPLYCPPDSTGGKNETPKCGTLDSNGNPITVCGCPSQYKCNYARGVCNKCFNPCVPNRCNTLNYDAIYYRIPGSTATAWSLGKDYLINSTPSPAACTSIDSCAGTFTCAVRQFAGYYYKNKELYVVYGSPTEGQSSYPATNCYLQALHGCSTFINPRPYFASQTAATNYIPLTLNKACANLPSETNDLLQHIECGYGGGHSSSGGGSCTCDPSTTDICCSCNGYNYGCTSTSECGAACA